MLFNSLQFLFFFVVVTSLYFALPHKYRWILLLAASCYFYMAFVPIYILILGFTIVIDYFAGRFIEAAEGRRRKLFLVCSILANIGVLCMFKYYNFLNGNFNHLLHGFGTNSPLPYLKILLPIGLSFHTFQAMSYTIEVYRGNQKAERHFGIYSLYVMFYPQLVAGPIERPQNLLHQFREKFNFDYEKVTGGLRLIVWGLFKKVVIADRLAILVDYVYKDPQSHNSRSLIIAAIFFTFQIFCDFSGYSDIAIGTARVMGFTLMKNFDRPFSSLSIAEYWNRWHISLSTWFRDYLFYPLTISLNKKRGNRTLKLYLNLFIVFLVSGLWHGANWTFVVFGALHGFYIVFAIISKNFREKIETIIGLAKFPSLSKFIDRVLVFVLVTFALIFFRSDSVRSAVYVITRIIKGIPDMLSKLLHHQSLSDNLGISKENLLFSVFLILFIEGFSILQGKINIVEYLKSKPFYLRWAVYVGCVFVILFLGVFEKRQFIYFQF
ncbi:MAG TPA: MBOAT family O-acyltransferase [Bacteroidia bacterium]|nr:MBOAT family O-acyltransferase [Bacteroidia bacterium]